MPSGQVVLSNITHDGTNVVREWSENTAGVKFISATYLLGASGAMYKRPSVAADVRWYVYDGLGSVVGEVDVSGTMLATKKHDVYGVSRGTTGTAKSKHGFVGSLGHYSDDETGLIYMRARYYDPNVGRFISQDPAGDGINWFVYSANDPVNKVDSNGREISSVLAMGGMAFATMASACATFAMEGMGAANYVMYGLAMMYATFSFMCFAAALLSPENTSIKAGQAIFAAGLAGGVGKPIAFHIEKALVGCISDALKNTGALNRMPGGSAKLSGDILGYSIAVAAAVWAVDAAF